MQVKQSAWRVQPSSAHDHDGLWLSHADPRNAGTSSASAAMHAGWRKMATRHCPFRQGILHAIFAKTDTLQGQLWSLQPYLLWELERTSSNSKPMIEVSKMTSWQMCGGCPSDGSRMAMCPFQHHDLATCCCNFCNGSSTSESMQTPCSCLTS